MTYIVTLNRQVLNPAYVQEQAARRAAPRPVLIDDHEIGYDDWYDATPNGHQRYVPATVEIVADAFEVSEMGNLVFSREGKAVATYAVNQWVSVTEVE